MRFTILVARRILSGVRHRYLSIVSRIALTGVALGVAALVVVLSISDGFGRAFRERILELYPHMVVLRRGADFAGHASIIDRIEATPGVNEAVSATYDEMMAIHRDRQHEVMLKGMPVGAPDLRRRLETALSRSADGDATGRRPLPELAPPVEAELDPAALTVTLTGGVRGVIAQILVDDTADAPRAIVSTPLWARPTPGRDRVILASVRGRAVRCEPTDSATKAFPKGRTFEIPEGGGFSRPRGLSEGLYQCGTPRDEGEEPRTWPLVVGGGNARTLVLDPAGSPISELDVDEPAAPSDVASKVRVYWPGAAGVTLSVSGTKHEPEGGAVTPWVPLGQLPLPGVLLGSAIAERLKADVGAEVRMMTPLRGLEGSGTGPVGMAPTVGEFRVAGVLRTGFHEFDSRFAITDIGVAQRLFDRGDVVRWVEVRIDDVQQTEAMHSAVRRALDPYHLSDLLVGMSDAVGDINRIGRGDVSQFPKGRAAGAGAYVERAARLSRLLRTNALDLTPDARYKVIDWRRMNRNLLNAIRLQRVVLTIFFLIIVIVAASNVVGNQIMLIHEKTPTIAILRAMGASRRQVARIFRVQGLVTAGSGTLIGVLLGLGVCFGLKARPLPLDPEIYFIERLPVEPSVVAVGAVVLATLGCVWFATRFSARRAAALDPREALHHID